MERERSKEFTPKSEYTCTVSICGYPVNIYSELDDFLPSFQDNKTPYTNDIPGWKVSSLAEASNCPSIYLSSSESNMFSYEAEENSLFIKGNPLDFSDGQVLAYVAFWLTERERQKDSVFTLHSSCFTVEDKGVLLVGDGGSGKTAIALGVCKRYDSEFISNDLSMVGFDKKTNQVSLLEGSKNVRLRQTTVQLNFPELTHLFPENDSNPWTTKLPIHAKQLNLKLASGPRKLDTVFNIHLDSNPNQKTTLKRINDIESQFCLYENLSRIIRGSAISVFDRNKGIFGYMPSLDAEQIHLNRVDFIDFLSKNMGIWSISGGNLDEMCNLIKNVSSGLSGHN